MGNAFYTANTGHHIRWDNAVQFAEELKGIMEQHLCLDESRSDFVINNGKIIFELVTNVLRDTKSTRHRIMLLGRKGVGKSTLVSELCNSAKLLLPNLLVLRLSCEELKKCGEQEAQLIYQICSLLGLWSSSSWNDIIGFLLRNDRHIFVVIDELQLASGS